MRTTLIAVASALTAMALLVGCSAVDEPAPTMTGGTNVIDDLTIDACPPGRGALTATGSVQNSGDDAADFVVRVSWLDEDGSVIASSWASLEALGAGESAEWKVAADLGDTAANSCTAALTRGDL